MGPQEATQPITPQTKARLLKTSEVSQELVVELFTTLVEARRNATEELPEHAGVLLNAFELVYLAQFELTALAARMVDAKSDMEAFLYSRLLLLAIYENARTLKSLLDHRFRAAYQAVLTSEDIDNVLKQSHSKICRVFDRCVRDFRDVRNKIAGHRDSDPEIRLQLIDRAEPEGVADLMIDFGGALNGIFEAQHGLTQAAVVRYGHNA